ncbi:secretion system X pseudopilin PulG-like protein [Methylophaga nitratireducenticrescens]|uniref:Secretion system X pseudopilin PulG n=1 Tax=Methylophaga nitratireducenticrescens TaxID=754476 RepID=I1XJA6_METNJ|nr:type II secretion system protein [Methylophaga nitratireducenticrescens]AFI84475.1 secretion system X pseudopilin PulG-like protein [Methylophaga nitratireducenticrescens]
MRNGNSQVANRGFILLGMLCLLVISGYILTQASAKWSDVVKREREQELLKVGDTIRKSIGSYYNATPGVVKQYPPNLQALLYDDRFPMPKRHIRKLYIDPVTQREGWGIVVAPNGGVMGVNSLSGEKPFKRKNFRPIYQDFEDKDYYGEWYFVYVENYL